MALHASPSNDCWNVAMSESFSPSDYNNFSNLPHIANNGFSRAEYGSSGAFSDVCALVPGMNNVQYFGLKVTLDAGYNYRLKWTGKSGGFAKSVQVHFGASTTSTQVIGNSHTMPLLNLSMPAPAFTSQSFTPPSNGQYYVLLKLAPGSIGSGSLRFDDLVLERSCSVIDPPAVFFTTQNAEAAEGGPVEICVGIQTPYIYHATQVQVAAAGPVQPHLASFSTQTLTFPAGSAQNQCFTFYIPANNEPDGDFSYRFVLQNPSSSGGNPYTAQPDTLILSVKDDILQNNCANWNPGITYNLDTDMPGNWQHGAPSSLSTDWADYAGDYAYKTDYSTAAYMAIPFQLSPLFSYRLQWKGRAQNTAGPAMPEILLMRGTAPNSGVLMPVPQQADGAWGIYTGEAFEVATAGTYYLTIKGGSTFFNLKTDLYIDDIVLERVCKTTSVAFSSITPQIVEGDEGALFRVCLDIITPSPHRATTVALAFNNGTSPHFSGAPSPLLVTFPAGSSERQCVDIPSALWPGDDPRSQYSLHIQSVTGGIYPVIGPDAERTLRVRDANTCWSTVHQQNFSAAAQNLSNVSGWVANNGAARSGYGATGQQFDYCAAMTMTPGSYAGFQQWLESGKQYRVKWNLKVDSQNSASVFLSLGTQAGIGDKVGVAVSIAPSGNQQPGIEFTSEYFTVPANGNYFLLLNAESGANPIVRFDDFRLEARCPDTEVFFQQSFLETAEGNALLVCVQIANPSPNSPTTVDVSFEGLQSPHFNGVPVTRTVTFPAGSSTPQCLLFPTTANGQYDGGAVEYILRLQNVAGNGARIAQPDRATLRVLDDVSLENCFWAGPDRQICLGQSTQLGLPGATMPAHCSAAPFCFRWEPAALILNGGQYDARPFVAPQQDTWFVIYMTDGHGNLHSDSVLVQVTASLQASISGHETPVCSGGARTLQVQTSGGAGSLSYQWQHSMDGGASWAVIAGVTGSVYTTPFLSASRMYRVAVGSSGCGNVVTAPATVQVLPDPSLSISASAASICMGGFSLLSASPANGTGACTTQWQSSSSASGPWNNIAGATGNNHVASTLVPGIRYYRASYTCMGGGCDAAFSNVVSVTVVPGPSISTQPAGATICSGSTRTLNVAATGGTPALSYQWQSSPNGANWSTHFGDTQSSLTTPPLTSNTYYRVAVSASGSGCGTVYSQAALVQVIALPDWSIAPAQAVLCPDTSLMLSVPDAQGVSFLWPDGSTAPQWEVQQPGAYSVVLTHPIHGCSKTLSTNVSAAPAWTQSIEASSDFLCDEESGIKLTVNGTSGGSYSYAWSGGGNTNQELANTPGVYNLTLTDDATGCSTVLSRVIQNSDTDIALRIDAPHTLLCRDSEMTLRAVLDGLHESLRERVRLEWWHEGSGQAETIIREPERYGVTADFGGGCVQEAIIEITRAPDLEVRIQSPEGTRHACPESPLLLRAVVSDSSLVAAYHWTGGADTPEAVFTESGVYTLRVTDVNGCVWEDRFEVQRCPTIVFFEDLRVQVKAEETAELCLRLINPSQETATTVEVAIEGSPAPYFGEAEALRSVEFAPGESRQCLSYLPPRVEEADSITLYTLRLQNAVGGNAAAIGEARQAELLIEAGIRCRVQQDSAAVNCALTDTTSIHNGVPLISTLKKDDSFWAGDFEVKVTQANGNGTFNGKGIITVPYLKQAQINVILKDVRVNEECQMVAGEVKVEGVGAAFLPEEVAAFLNNALSAIDSLDNALAQVQQILQVVGQVLDAYDGLSNYLASTWTLTDGLGPLLNEYPYLPDSTVAQIHQAVQCFHQAENGTRPQSECINMMVAAMNALQQSLVEMFQADYQVRFSAYQHQRYGLDTIESNVFEKKYDIIRIAAESYTVPWKSLAINSPDTVLLKTLISPWPADLSIEDNKGQPIPVFEVNGDKAIRITGESSGNKLQFVYPVQTKFDTTQQRTVKKYAGKLSVKTYLPKESYIALVPVGNLPAALDTGIIAQRLRQIYRQAVNDISLKLEPVLSVPGFNGVLSGDNSGILHDYNGDMRDVIRAFNATLPTPPDGSIHYFFLIDDAASEFMLGRMPRNELYGFIITSHHNSADHIAHTIAHELGHGAYALEHTFDEFQMDQASSDNLMDYRGGDKLMKYQWDLVHNPRTGAGAFDSDEDDASVATLPCTLPKGIAILTPDRVGLMIPESQTLTVVADFHSSTVLQKIALKQQNKLYQWKHIGNHDPYGYVYVNDDTNEDKFNTGVNRPASTYPFITGLKQMIGGDCYCVLYRHDPNPTGAPFSIVSDGVSNTNSITQLGTVPAPSNGVVISSEKAHYSHCDLNDPRNILSKIFHPSHDGYTDPVTGDSNKRKAKSVSGATDLNGMFEAAQQSFQGNGYRVAIYYYDHGSSSETTDDRLTIYRPTDASVFNTQETIRTELQKFEAKNFGSGIDFAFLVDRQLKSTGNADVRFHIEYTPNYLQPLAALNTAPGFGFQRIDLSPPPPGEPPFKLGEKSGYEKEFKDLAYKEFDNSGDISKSFRGDHPTQNAGDDGELKADRNANFFTWGGFAVSELGHLVRTGEVNTGLWNSQDAHYANKILHIYAPVAGAVDQTCVAIKDLHETVALLKEVVKDPVEVVNSMYTNFASMSPAEIAYSLTIQEHAELIETYQNSPPGQERQYTGSRVVVGMTIVVIGLVTSGGVPKLALGVVKKAGKRGAVVRKIRTFSPVDPPQALTDNLQRLKRDKLIDSFLEDVNAMGEASGDLDGIVAKINNAPGMVSAWEKLSGLPQIFRTLDNITAVDAFEKINPGSLDAIGNIAITIKPSRRQSFLNALDRISDNNILGQTLTKSRIASADEIKDALNKIRDYRSGVPSGGNYGYIDGNVTGVTIDNNKMWRSVSLEDAQAEIHIFDAVEATGNSGTWQRITDSEYRMLNKLAHDLGGQAGNRYPGIAGSLKIVSENPYCQSCQGVIKQFNDMFPDIEIILIDGVK